MFDSDSFKSNLYNMYLTVPDLLKKKVILSK